MSAKNISLTSRVTRSLHAIGALLGDVSMTVKTPDFCCGVRFDRTRPQDEMPTPSSCCGVRI